VAADAGPEKAWSETADRPADRVTLIDSIILHLDPSFRAAFQPLLAALMARSDSAGDVRHAAIRALPLMGPDYAATNFQLLMEQLRPNHDMADIARAVMQMPRETWDATRAAAAAEIVRQWAGTVPAEKRTSRDFVETVQLGMELAEHLPAADATHLRRELLELGVRTFSIKAVREQMRYDTTRIVVEAGKPFEIIFENVDMMPHNLVIVQPGAREEIGKQAEAMSPSPDREGRTYVPRNRKILAATRMLEPGDQETLKLSAPEEPGEYEYVCTYPEHWSVMFGQLLVVKDLETFLQNTPPAPLIAPQHIAPHHARGG
jgi:azurin